jgi:hypothetical protein
MHTYIPHDTVPYLQHRNLVVNTCDSIVILYTNSSRASHISHCDLSRRVVYIYIHI